MYTLKLLKAKVEKVDGRRKIDLPQLLTSLESIVSQRKETDRPQYYPVWAIVEMALRCLC